MFRNSKIVPAFFALSMLALMTTAQSRSVPFPGGVLVIFFDGSANTPCPADVIHTYPKPNVQYWLDGKDLWQIRTEDGDRTVRRLDVSHFRGLVSIYETAQRIDPHEYGCHYRLLFNPNDPNERKSALSQEKIYVGQLRQWGHVWVWDQKED